MGTIKLSDYPANSIRQIQLVGASMIAGTCTEADIVKHPFKKLLAVVCSLSTAQAADSRLYADVTTAGQVTFSDSANTGDTVEFILIGY